ncbi:hypothetical protein OR1_01325 [Geobacter sp. OR-1]|uniref:hypothetical protein n=1 Tax=Geobacter sp. OR-1 TaxID=1266765 RepID=UPI0005422F1B|nr:hypothetical protein [Geobacter sp. OR-1]GAM09051.1 hypothetical protein OR1_01325 [Geobacter sp. OR-1]
MQETPYKIHRIMRQLSHGCTRASKCTLPAILKFDCDDSPHCVYNENVVVRLGQTLHVPIADGVLTHTGDGPAFASLEIGSPGLSLPNVIDSRIERIARTYPGEAAALTAFDILIGNWDRKQNLKASVATPHIKLFLGFDHSHALLNLKEDPWDSIKCLGSTDLTVRFHPFYGYVDLDILHWWAERIAATPDAYIRECCMMGKTFRAVTEDLQEYLSQALVKRKNLLPSIIAENEPTITGEA